MADQNDPFPYKMSAPPFIPPSKVIHNLLTHPNRTLKLPFPTPQLASTAHRALAVDAELSPLVRRSFATSESDAHELVVEYAATTNRMLRVAVNGFLESVGVVLGVMRELDTDVYDKGDVGDLSGVQGLEVKS